MTRSSPIFLVEFHRAMPIVTRTFAVQLLMTVLLIASSGCSSVLTYQALDLPPEFSAPQVVDASQLDLHQLGSAYSDQGTIRPRDVLTIVTAAGDEVNSAVATARTSAEAPVDDNGMVDVPLVGSISVAGRTLSQAAQAIRNASIERQIYISPAVSVLFKEKNVRIVTVTGAVETPGRYELRPGTCTVAAALQAAGGLTNKADPDIEVQIPGTQSSFDGSSPVEPPPLLTAGHESTQSGYSSRTSFSGSLAAASEPQLLRVSLLDPASSQLASRNDLPDGTVITVPQQPERFISVIGLANNKAVELPYDRDYHVLDAVAAAGGPRYSPWIANKIKVMRPHPQTGETISIKMTMGEAKRNRAANITLAAGDVVSIEETPLTFTIGTIGALAGIGANAARAVLP